MVVKYFSCAASNIDHCVLVAEGREAV